jgi:hypothetical protein
MAIASRRFLPHIVAAAMLTPAAMAQDPDPLRSVFYGNLDQQSAGEVATWAALYWARVEAGGTAAEGADTFAFNNPAMNSPLFNPLRAVRPTLEKVGVVDPQLCDGLEMFGALEMTEAMIAQRDAIRAAMLEAKIRTVAVENPAGTIMHLEMILSAPAGAGMQVEVDGNALISFNLPLAKVSQQAYEAALALALPVPSQQCLAALIASAPQWAAESGKVSEAKRLISGQSSRAEVFATKVALALHLMGVADSSAEPVSAVFGVYGELPLVAVQLPGAFILLDALRGSFAGPFEPDSPINAEALLAAYPQAFAPGSGVRYYNKAGCIVMRAPRWRDTPPPGTWLPTPPLPTPPGIAPGSAPDYRWGRWDNWHCWTGRDPQGNEVCVCESKGKDTGPGVPPANTHTRIRCTCPPRGTPPDTNCDPPANSYPNLPPGPGTPAQPPPTPLPWTGCSCQKQWLW